MSAKDQSVAAKYQPYDFGVPKSFADQLQGRQRETIIRLLFRISDHTQLGKGTENVVEIVRRLVLLRGTKSVSDQTSIEELGKLASYLYSLSINSSLQHINEKDKFQQLDLLIRSLNDCSNWYYNEPFSECRITSLLPASNQKSHLTEKKYPMLIIRVSLVRDCISDGISPKLVEFVCSRFLEKTFCRIAEKEVEKSPVSRIAVLLDFLDIALPQYVTSSISVTVNAIENMLAAFGPSLLKAVILLGIRQAGVVMWRPLVTAIHASANLDKVRILMFESKAEAEYCIGQANVMTFSPYFGNLISRLEDPCMRRYACDFNASISDHLQPSALLLDDFWSKAENLKSRLLFNVSQRKQSDPRISEKEKDQNLCQINDFSVDKLKTLETVVREPCAGPLLTKLDDMKNELMSQKRNEFLGSQTSADHWIRYIARDGLLNTTIPFKSKEKKKGTTVSDNMISRSPVNICVWKGLGYSELRRPIHIP